MRGRLYSTTNLLAHYSRSTDQTQQYSRSIDQTYPRPLPREVDKWTLEKICTSSVSHQDGRISGHLHYHSNPWPGSTTSQHRPSCGGKQLQPPRETKGSDTQYHVPLESGYQTVVDKTQSCSHLPSWHRNTRKGGLPNTSAHKQTLQVLDSVYGSHNWKKQTPRLAVHRVGRKRNSQTFFFCLCVLGWTITAVFYIF